MPSLAKHEVRLLNHPNFLDFASWDIFLLSIGEFTWNSVKVDKQKKSCIAPIR